MRGVLEQVGPTTVVVLPDGACRAAQQAVRSPLPLEKNRAPFKHARCAGGAIEVDPGFVPERWPERESHVTVVPASEAITPAQVAKLVGREVAVELEPACFWTRGSSGNAACGTLGAFYCNVVLSDATVRDLEALRAAAGLPPRPPAPAQAGGSDDPRLATYRFHKSVGCIIPAFMHDLDAAAAEDPRALRAFEQRLRAWMDAWSIEPAGAGNVLVPRTDPQ